MKADIVVLAEGVLKVDYRYSPFDSSAECRFCGESSDGCNGITGHDILKHKNNCPVIIAGQVLGEKAFLEYCKKNKIDIRNKLNYA